MRGNPNVVAGFAILISFAPANDLRLRRLVSPERCASARDYAVRIAQMLAKLAR